MADEHRPGLWPGLLRRIARITRNREEAEDIVQAAFVRMLEYRQQRVVESPDAFLARTAVNLALDGRRRSLRRGAGGLLTDHEDISDDSPLQDEVFETRERLARLQAGLQQLSPRTREVFLLHRLEGLKYREIAEKLGITVSAVEKHVAKAALFLTGWTEQW